MEKISLAGKWTLSQIHGSLKVPMAVPGDILSALIAEKIIPDPYMDRNEEVVQWVGRMDWQLERDFEVSPALLENKRIFLDIAVLDTVAEISINGFQVGTSTNMFAGFRRDLSGILRNGINHISITISSPEKVAAKLAAELPYPIPESSYPNSSPHRNLLRKAQCMSGWDWGPCLLTGGVYDEITLTGTDGPRIESVRTDIVASEGYVFPIQGQPIVSGPDFKVTVIVEANSQTVMDAVLAVSLGNETYRSSIKLPEGNSRHEIEFCIKKPSLWWPAEMGTQALYDMEVALGAAKNDAMRQLSSSHILHRKIGFRQLEVSTQDDAIGREMKFVVNGRDIFAKGANWIPADALPSLCTREKIAGLLSSAVEAHMNCLRVWGGGRYESDAFYDVCDELGILIWQDCMFSCALYPSSPEFLSSVEEEIQYQVKRLGDHPCIALWCGNNEAMGAISWYEESKKNPARYIVDYDRLTEGVLGRVIRELDPRRCWWPSSPSAGPNDFSDNWHSDESGDMHFWSVWHEGKPFSEYLTMRPRFCSEFGFQSFPGFETVSSFTPSKELNVSSPAMEAHQRHPRGNSLIMDTMMRYFRMPKNFRETLYLSQVQQAMAIGMAVSYWRTERPRCMGTLYWQLNDVWPVTSWSSIEYNGSWKLLHHEAKRFYDPILLALFVVGDKVELRAVSDTFTNLHGTFEVSCVDFKGQVSTLFSGTAELRAEKAIKLWSMPLEQIPEPLNHCIIEAKLMLSEMSPVGTDNPDFKSRRTILFPTEPKRCELQDAKLAVRIEKIDIALFVTIEARAAPAFYVALEFDGLRGRFEDAGFHLSKGESRKLRFYPDANCIAAAKATIADLVSSLRIHDLRGSYE